VASSTGLGNWGLGDGEGDGDVARVLLSLVVVVGMLGLLLEPKPSCARIRAVLGAVAVDSRIRQMQAQLLLSLIRAIVAV
jgi:hypothetical protein